MDVRHRLFELFDAHGDELYALAGILTGDPAHAEPIVSAAFADVHNELRGANPLEPAPVVDAARLRRAVCERSHRVASTPSRGGSRSALSSSEDENALLAALRSLPHRQRDAVVLHCWLALDDQALAASLGTPPVDARAAVQRGIAAISARLESQSRRT